MSLRSRFVTWWKAVARSGELERQVAEELQFHIESHADDLKRSGMSHQEAQRRARAELGSFRAVRENCRIAWGTRVVDDLHGDLRYALRTLAKSPSFAAIAIGSLALGIGANTAVFSAAKRLLYDRLDVPHADQLRLLEWTGDNRVAVHSFLDSIDSNAQAITAASFSWPVYRELHSHHAAMKNLFAFRDFQANATILGTARRVQAVMVSGNYYTALDVRPQLGRSIEMLDDAPASGAVAVISNDLWERDFGHSLSVLGQTIMVNQTPLTIIGVNPPGFTGTAHVRRSPDIFVPLVMQPKVYALAGSTSGFSNSDLWWLQIMGRVEPGAESATTQAALSVVLASAVHTTMQVQQGDTMPRVILADGSRGLHQINGIKKPISVLMAMVVLVLMLACTNIANLLLARAAKRRQEVGVRLAIGAGRGRILRQLLTESILLAALGGACGLTLGYLGRNVFPDLYLNSLQERGVDVHLDLSAFAFVAALTMLTGLGFGVAPAWAAIRVETATSLKENARTSRHCRGFAAKSLVAFQLALSTLLIVSSGLFVRTVLALTAVNLGFRPDHLILFDVSSTPQQDTPKKQARLYLSLEHDFRNVPGIEAATVMSVPYVADYTLTTFFVTLQEAADPRRRAIHRGGEQFLPSMGIRILSGRGFGPQDRETSPPVAVINESLAKARFPHENAIGKLFRFGVPIQDKWVQVVGICADTRYTTLRDSAPPQFFVPYSQRPEEAGGFERMTYALRTNVQLIAILPALRRIVQQSYPGLPITNIRTQQEQIEDNLRLERTFATLTTAFGALALLLGCIGIYGMMSYSVSRRTKEIGIRMALGAPPGLVMRNVLREASWLTAVGVVAGMTGALALGHTIAAMLYRVKAYDAPTFVASAMVLIIVALAASWIPARRAASVDPMQAVRHE